MKIGNLVKVGPSFIGLYIVTSLKAHNPHAPHPGNYYALKDCYMLVCLDNPSPPAPMNKKWIKVISEAR